MNFCYSKIPFCLLIYRYQVIKIFGGDMPVYDFKCNKCNKTFSLQISISEYSSKKTFTCPKCKSKSVKRVYSDFMAVTSKKS
jgi:putative FmdB family regulatory protein